MKKFNRKTINPSIYPSEDERMLSLLRRRGQTRGYNLRRRIEEKFKDAPPNKFYGLRSSAYDEAMFCKNKGTFIDMGAGWSPDSIIAKMDGFKKAYAVDLFPCYSLMGKQTGIEIVKADICEKMPFKKNSADLIICQAVLPLMVESDRVLFYRNAHRILKKGGWLSVYFCKLKNGYEFNVLKEKKAALKIGFGLYRCSSNGFVISKL